MLFPGIHFISSTLKIIYSSTPIKQPPLDCDCLKGVDHLIKVKTIEKHPLGLWLMASLLPPAIQAN